MASSITIIGDLIINYLKIIGDLNLSSELTYII